MLFFRFRLVRVVNLGSGRQKGEKSGRTEDGLPRRLAEGRTGEEASRAWKKGYAAV